MKKKVNVNPALIPIYTINPPIVRPVKGCMLSVGDIALCLMARANVDEVFDDGSTLRLNLQNYNTVNKPKTDKEVVPEKKVADERSKSEEQHTEGPKGDSHSPVSPSPKASVVPGK